MTTVIGLKTDDNVYIGADSQVTNGWASQNLATSKIIRRGDILLGVAGDIRLLQIIQYICDTPDRPSDISDERYMIAYVGEAWRKAAKEYGYATSDNGQDKQGTHAMVAYKNNLYCFESNFQVVQVQSGVDALGTGREFALGAMMALENQLPETRIQRALEISAVFDIGTSAPFQVEKYTQQD